jgi:hypothetical protein
MPVSVSPLTGTTCLPFSTASRRRHRARPRPARRLGKRILQVSSTTGRSALGRSRHGSGRLCAPCLPVRPEASAVRGPCGPPGAVPRSVTPAGPGFGASCQTPRTARSPSFPACPLGPWPVGPLLKRHGATDWRQPVALPLYPSSKPSSVDACLFRWRDMKPARTLRSTRAPWMPRSVGGPVKEWGPARTPPGPVFVPEPAGLGSAHPGPPTDGVGPTGGSARAILLLGVPDPKTKP